MDELDGAGDLLAAWLDDEPRAFYAQVTLVVQDHAPLLERPRLARAAFEAVRAGAPNAPGTLWGALIMPAWVRLVVGPAGSAALDAFVAAVKARVAARVLEQIRRADDDSLDRVLRYSPVWGGAIYRVWQPGYHRQVFWSEYRLSTALYELGQLPVAAGLADAPGAWPWLWIGGQADV